jgi:hypothetical protein
MINKGYIDQTQVIENKKPLSRSKSKKRNASGSGLGSTIGLGG